LAASSLVVRDEEVFRDATAETFGGNMDHPHRRVLL